MLPLISVNLPTFNRAHFIKQAIDSVLQQTFTNWELNILDNCSTDGTWEIINSYNDSRIRTYRNEESVVFRCNLAVQLSRGQYVCFLGDDDWFAPNRLERLLKFLQDNPECWGVCDYFIEVDEKGNKALSGSGFFEAYFNRDVYNGDFHHALVNCINAEAIGLFKRAYYDEVGEFEEGVIFCDMRMHVRNLAKGLRIGSLPEQLHFKRRHANSATSKMTDGLTFECFYLFKYVYKELYLPDRNPMHLMVYIKWLLFERGYKNVAPEERRRLLDYVTGTNFPFDTFAEFHAHVTQAVPVVDVTNPQEEAAKYPPATEPIRADPGHQEMIRELVHFLLEKCLAGESDIEIARLNELIVDLSEERTRLYEEIGRHNGLEKRMLSAPVELHILAGQSNAQGFRGDAAHCPGGAQIPFFYNAPGFGDSDGQWTILGPQSGGDYPKGYFGPEITFALALQQAGSQPAIFKFTAPSTSLAKDWKGPGESGLLDTMCRELQTAIKLLETRHLKVKLCSFTWIQGESDAETDAMAVLYHERLAVLVRHVREILHEPDLPIILGVDEQHPWVKERPVVVEAQKQIVATNKHMAFLSMLGLEKADTSHLTPNGLVKHGERLFETWQKLAEGLDS